MNFALVIFNFLDILLAMFLQLHNGLHHVDDDLARVVQRKGVCQIMWRQLNDVVHHRTNLLGRTVPSVSKGILLTSFKLILLPLGDEIPVRFVVDEETILVRFHADFNVAVLFEERLGYYKTFAWTVV